MQKYKSENNSTVLDLVVLTLVKTFKLIYGIKTSGQTTQLVSKERKPIQSVNSAHIFQLLLCLFHFISAVAFTSILIRMLSWSPSLLGRDTDLQACERVLLRPRRARRD